MGFAIPLPGKVTVPTPILAYESSLPATVRMGRQRVEAVATPPDLDLSPVRADAWLPRVRGYDIISIFGSGGMGIVYEARHRELNRRVAIKTLRGAALADPEFHDRFRAEAEAIARLQHPNIIQVFEVGTIDPLPSEVHASPFLALEFVNGGSLADRIGSPQAPHEAARTVETLARAAHVAHLVGVIHRDLKPDNVLLTREGEPKIADFGIAKQLDAACEPRGRSVTLAGMIVGTPEYMAPEQVAGETPTRAIDIYALGVILYELLTAHVPFKGATHAETMDMVRSREPISPRQLLPRVPRDLETICLKCLAKDPSQRYETAEALADDLARWAAGHTIRARAAGRCERALRWARRNPMVATLSAAIVIVGLAGLSGVIWEWQLAERHAKNADASAFEATQAAKKAQEATQRERWERYRVSVMAASGAIRLHDTATARRALDDAPGDHRDWVWQLLRAQVDQSRIVLNGGDKATRFATFRSEARWAVLRGNDGCVRLWDVAEQKPLRPEGLGPKTHTIAIGKDGRTFAFDPGDRSVRVWDRLSGETRTVLPDHGDPINDIWLDDDGTAITTCSGFGLVRRWDVATGRLGQSFQVPAGANPVVLSPDGRIVAARDGEGLPTARLWDFESGRELAVLGGGAGSIHGLHFNPRGDRIAVIQRFPDNAIHLWDVVTHQRLATFKGHENQVIHVQFSPDGSRLATTSADRTVRVWDTLSGPIGRETGPMLTLQGHSSRVNHAAFSPDGAYIISSSDDRTLRSWSARTGEQMAVHCGHSGGVLSAAFRDDGALVSAAEDGTIRFWDVDGGECGSAIRGHSKFAYHVAFFPDGKRIASAAWDGTARIWDPTTGKQLLRLDHNSDQYVSAVAVHSGEKYLATLARPEGGNDMHVYLWDLRTGELLKRWRTQNGWQGGRVTFAPRGDVFAAGCIDGCVRLWDAGAQSEVGVLVCGGSPIRDVAFSPDGTLLAAACDDGDNTVRIWDVASRKQLQVLRGHARGVYSVTWNRAGTMLASGSFDYTARLWDTKTWTEIAVLPQGAEAYGVAFTRDDKLLACACADNLIRIWDINAGREIAELSGHRNYVHHLAFSPDGSRMISASGDQTLRVWDTLPKADRAQRQKN